MASYKPKSITISSSAINNGEILSANAMTLVQWNRYLHLGIVKNGLGNPVTNAAVEIIKLATGGSTKLGVVFTNAKGEYGVSLEVLTNGQSYRFDSYIPLTS